MRSVIDRFAQIEPVVLVAVDGYRYGRKDIDRAEHVAEIVAALPTLRHVVHIPYLAPDRRRPSVRRRRVPRVGRAARSVPRQSR